MGKSPEGAAHESERQPGEAVADGTWGKRCDGQHDGGEGGV